MADTKGLVIKASDMEESELKKLHEVTIAALKETLKDIRQEKVVARFIKNEFDKNMGFGWNCVVGRNFGSHVVHQTKKYVFFQIRELSVLLWKS